MIDFNIKIADTVFSISTTYKDTFNMCRDYLVNTSGKLIKITQSDIDCERENSKREAMLENVAIPNYKDGYLETIAVYRKIADILSYDLSAVFHGALIEKDGVGYLFTAKSGTGKTTHIQNWVKAYPKTQIINGDKPIIKIEREGVFAHGTPWSGKENYNINKRTKLKAIIILKRDKTNHIEKTSLDNALPKILAQVHKPKDDLGIKRATVFAITLIKNVDIYTLYCNMDIQSAIVAYNGIQ